MHHDVGLVPEVPGRVVLEASVVLGEQGVDQTDRLQLRDERAGELRRRLAGEHARAAAVVPADDRTHLGDEAVGAEDACGLLQLGAGAPGDQ